MIVLGLYGVIHYIMNLVFFVYQLFEKLVDRQFFAKIKCLQTDGGGEFIGHRLQRYLSEQGILHQIPCPHTLEQNRVVERRHHSIVEAGMAQLFHSKVPNDFWVFSFQTAVHVINQRPYSVLPHNILSYFALFGNEPDYSSLRVFGWSCCPCLRAYNYNKF